VRKDVLKAALVCAIGAGIVLRGGGWFGWAFILIAAGQLVLAWRARDIPPTDPLFLADVDKSMELQKSDPAGADRVMDRAIDDADRREERHRADLLRRAMTDRQAAVELRNRLRYELKLMPAVRKKAEEMTLSSSARAGALKEIDRRADECRKQLAEVEQLIG
jgi:hypothetical protein